MIHFRGLNCSPAEVADESVSLIRSTTVLHLKLVAVVTGWTANNRILDAHRFRNRFEKLADAFLARALKLSDFSAVFVHLKGGHAIDASCLRDICCRVNVALAEGPASVLIFYRHRCKFGSNVLAGWAPGRREINDHWFA